MHYHMRLPEVRYCPRFIVLWAAFFSIDFSDSRRLPNKKPCHTGRTDYTGSGLYCILCLLYLIFCYTPGGPFLYNTNYKLWYWLYMTPDLFYVVGALLFCGFNRKSASKRVA